MVIAIDGPAASGKGTLSRALAERLGFAHLDTGALYRAVAYEVMQAGGDPEDEGDALAGVESLKAKLSNPSINILHNSNTGGGKEGNAGSAGGSADVLGNPILKEDHVGGGASKVAAIPSVRAALLDLQRDFAAHPGEGFEGAVLDGRDIGTVICPQAPVKLFVTASDEVRAERRTKELQSKGISVTKAAVLKDMCERDARDASRTEAPMKPADDAILIDSSHLDPAEMLDKALKIVQERLSL
ncbi:MAG: (d)CMP kinase [Alphaproteobacteria bacterium]|nr:(d)CMP kinase [Alphaproteobacteria bacterium]